jgi:hypothetical protein
LASSFWQINQSGHLTAVLLHGIILDPTGTAKMDWRRQAWEQARIAERQPGGARPVLKAISATDLADPA